MNGKEMVTTEQSNELPSEYTGSLAVSLARAEVDQQITTARTFPRSIARAVEHILTLATLDETAASECIYARPQGMDDSGQKKIIKGPSIRLAEIVASQWGNCRVGARVVHVDRFEKYVEAEGLFHDLETNMATTARTRRSIANKYGKLYREDMIIMAGNAACAIAKRNAILGGVPRGVWRKAYDAVESVISGDVKTLVSRRRVVFATLAAEYKITADQIFRALDIGGEEDIDLERLSLLTAMRSSIKNGEASVEELFPSKQQHVTNGLNNKLDAIATGGNGTPKHDPETGEIISDEASKHVQEGGGEFDRALADPTCEKAGALLAQRLRESAAQRLRESADFASPAIAGQLKEHAANLAPQREDAGAGPIPPETVPASDRRLQELIDTGRAKAIEGPQALKKWHARLNDKDFNLIRPHLAAIEKTTE